MNEEILSIYIPTYNRPIEIQTQVRLLLPQLNNKVSLVVFDNCSCISVKELFSTEELLRFTIKRNKINVGADANIARCFEDCSTPWLWTLSDDDYVKTNSVETVLNEILKNEEAVFICFGNNQFRKISGFEKLAYEFRRPEIYSQSFAMSYCIYNVSKLQKSLQVYYNYLSSMVGTIILVLKYVQKNKNEICIYSIQNPIQYYSKEVSWNYGTYINRTRLFIDAFRCRKNNFNKTLFLGCHKTNYNLIILDRKGSKMTERKKWSAYMKVISNQGIINAILYSPKLLIYTFIILCIGPKNQRKIDVLLRKFKSRLSLIKN